LEVCKIAGDQGIISGTTHSIFHGFNYSPPSAGFPGWVRYGTYISEQNQWWPYFKLYNQYRARIAALLQQSTMFADIALLAPIPDLWSKYSAQNEPFPATMHPPYQTLIWESIHQNGNGCDYISERIIEKAELKDGFLHYGSRKYHTLILIEVESMEPSIADKLYEFTRMGGRILCIGNHPSKSSGFNNCKQRDEEIKKVMVKVILSARPIFDLINKPEKDFSNWFKNIQGKHEILPYVQVKNPNPFVSQIRYQQKDTEIFFFNNSNIDKSFKSELNFAREITNKKQGWIWDPETGERYRIQNPFVLELGPAESKLIVFDKNTKGKDWKSMPENADQAKSISQWRLSCAHMNGNNFEVFLDSLHDLKDNPRMTDFAGTITYSSNFNVNESSPSYLNLGKVYGIAELFINGENCGVKWYGNRIFSVAGKMKKGDNKIEIKIVTGVGNYVKSLKDNRTAYYWTNDGRRNQPLQSIGIDGPVTIY